jgi:signal transduction histidine kinase
MDDTLCPQNSQSSSPQGIWPIAYDLKNCSGLISKAFEDLQRHFEAAEPPRHAITQLRWLLTHIDYLATALLEGLRAEALERTTVSLNDFVLDREHELTTLISSGITLTLRLSAVSGVVLAKPSELERLLFGLVSQACQSMPQGGDLTVSTGWLDHVAGPNDPGVRPRRYVRLTVSDTGDGVDTRVRLTETLPDHCGGSPRENAVSAVWRLGGWLIVESQEQAGSRVHACLPSMSIVG